MSRHEELTQATPVVDCRACGSILPTAPLLDLGMQPLANNLCDEQHHSDETYPLRLLRCGTCGLLQLDTIVDPALMFSHYLYTPSLSAKTLSHFEELADSATARMTSGFAVDVGSNDGALLGFLAARGWRVAGVDPAENLARQANEAGLPTLCRFFDEEAVDELLSTYGPARLITANNVFAHTPDWRGFVRCAKRLLAPGGLVAIEFPYGPDMLYDGTFDLIYFEHASFPAIGPLRRLLNPFGLHVVDINYLPSIHGGSVRVWIGKQSEHAASSTVERTERQEVETYSFAACARFAEKVQQARIDLTTAVAAEKAAGRRVVGYTAPAKAVTLLEFCGLGVDDVDYIIDDNPLKQGRKLPVSHIPVVPSQGALRDGDTAIIFAWNVAEDIMAKLPDGVDVIIPMPRVQVVRRPIP